MEYDRLLELVKKRRSTRWFKPDPIPDGYVEKIIEVARWAPSGFNTQPWEFVVVKKKELREKIIDILESNFPAVPVPKDAPGTPEEKKSKPPARMKMIDRNIPVFIILCSDWRTKDGLPEMLLKSPEGIVKEIFCSGLASAFLYMHLAAASLGLASQWSSAVSMVENQRKIKDLLGIPEALTLYDMMSVGYGAHDPKPKLVKTVEDMTHYDDCGTDDFKTDEEVLDFAQKTKAWCLSAH